MQCLHNRLSFRLVVQLRQMAVTSCCFKLLREFRVEDWVELRKSHAVHQFELEGGADRRKFSAPLILRDAGKGPIPEEARDDFLWVSSSLPRDPKLVFY